MNDNATERFIKLHEYESLDKKDILLNYHNDGVCFIKENGESIMCNILGVAVDEGNWYVKVSNNPDKWVSLDDVYIVEE